MSLGPSVTLSSVELVNLDLLTFLDRTNSSYDLRTLNIRSSELRYISVNNGKNLLCLVRGALFEVKKVDEDLLALFRHTVLKRMYTEAGK